MLTMHTRMHHYCFYVGKKKREGHIPRAKPCGLTLRDVRLPLLLTLFSLFRKVVEQFHFGGCWVLKIIFRIFLFDV